MIDMNTEIRRCALHIKNTLGRQNVRYSTTHVFWDSGGKPYMAKASDLCNGFVEASEGRIKFCVDEAEGTVFSVDFSDIGYKDRE